MAIFGKKKNNDEPLEGAPPENGAAPAEAGDSEESPYSPEKASVFFDRAQSVFETTNYEYAMQLWLNGLGWDPTSMDGLRGFIRAGEAFVQENGKKGVSKETVKAVSRKGGVNRYIQALLTYGTKPLDTVAAVKSAEAAASLNLHEPAAFLGRAAMGLGARDKKPRKDVFVRLLEVFEKSGAFEDAVRAGAEAMRIDPSDGPLNHRVRNMSAQATMSKGGYEDTGEAGGFRKNIRDADKQAQLEQQDRIVKSDSAKDQIIEQAEAAARERPDDLPTIEALCKALLERGKDKDELRTITIYNELNKKTKQFRFRQKAGEIGLRRQQRTLRKLRADAEANPGDREKTERYDRLLAEYRKKELEELELQVQNYPTDLTLKFKLGKTYFDMEEYSRSIEFLQQAQEDPKNRRIVQNLLGHAFLRLTGWDEEAVQTFKRALDGIPDENSELGMELRYGLLCALQSKAESEKDLEAATEADRIASAIAIQQFGYRDIRERRETLKALIAEIRG